MAGGGGETRIGETGEAVRHDKFFGQAEEKCFKSRDDVVQPGTGREVAAELRDDVAWPDDGSGDEMREKRDEAGIFKEAWRGQVAPIAIDQEHDLLKREETDAKRQENGDPRMITEDDAKKCGVFEKAQQGEIDAKPEDEPKPLVFGRAKAGADGKITEDRGD